MYKARDSVKIWNWKRRGSVPNVIRNGARRGQSVVPDASWGPPDANFPFNPDYCNYDQHFNAHQIVFDLTLCVSAASTSLKSSV